MRGKHSTGVAGITNNNQLELVKKVGHPYNLLQSEEWTKLKRRFYKVLIGHNRYATQGAHTEGNAHPFDCGDVIGAHNGTLDHFSDIRPLVGGTDSEAIFRSIQEIGVDATIPKMSGAWALVWYDFRDKTLNMIRNDKRPLSYTYDKDRHVVVWASERRMLEFALNLNAESAVFSPSENTLFTWDLTNENKPLSAPKQRLIEGKPEAAKKGNWFQDHFGYGEYETYTPNYKGAAESSSTSSKTSGPVINIRDRLKARQKDKRKNFRPPYIDQGGKVINKVEFNSFVEEGCVFCNDADQAWGDEIHIIGNFRDKMTSYICGSCAEDDDIFDIVMHSV